MLRLLVVVSPLTCADESRSLPITGPDADGTERLIPLPACPLPTSETMDNRLKIVKTSTIKQILIAAPLMCCCAMNLPVR